MKVILRSPPRELELPGRRRVKELLRDLNILPDTVLVIRGKELLTSDSVVAEEDVIELRPVISGGSGACSGPAGSKRERGRGEARVPALQRQT